MVLFALLGLMAVAAAFVVTPPLRRHGEAPARADYDLQIYRDQLREHRLIISRATAAAAGRRWSNATRVTNSHRRRARWAASGIKEIARGAVATIMEGEGSK